MLGDKVDFAFPPRALALQRRIPTSRIPAEVEISREYPVKTFIGLYLEANRATDCVR